MLVGWWVGGATGDPRPTTHDPRPTTHQATQMEARLDVGGEGGARELQRERHAHWVELEKSDLRCAVSTCGCGRAFSNMPKLKEHLAARGAQARAGK